MYQIRFSPVSVPRVEKFNHGIVTQKCIHVVELEKLIKKMYGIVSLRPTVAEISPIKDFDDVIAAVPNKI